MERNTRFDFRIFNRLNTFKYQFLSSKFILIIIFNIHFGAEGFQPNYHRAKLTAVECPVGYYIKNIEHSARCLPCKLCPKGFQVNKWCNVTNETECTSCPKGTFNDVRGGSCQPCSTCKVGEFIKRKCLPEKDTKCRRCQKGKYSVNGQGHACRPCTGCLESNREEMFPCKPEHDRVCGQCKHGHFSELGGRCLPCSFCGYMSQKRFVIDCARQNGVHDPNLCWPDTGIRLLQADSKGPTTVVSNEIVLGYHNDNVMLVFIVCVFVICWIVLVFTGAWAMRLPRFQNKFKLCLNHEDSSATQSKIPTRDMNLSLCTEHPETLTEQILSGTQNGTVPNIIECSRLSITTDSDKSGSTMKACTNELISYQKKGANALNPTIQSKIGETNVEPRRRAHTWHGDQPTRCYIAKIIKNKGEIFKSM
ncbi:TNR16-like protein [Mya arenaria]|uniref:TNR16-like protein n=1 Tax=Mya arenaria TaxID=6604 RepID=A0ABY7G2A3_MYAAR|nr:uncharacterized protein LOC128219959 [Mya arenaria]WAR27248.1 TNR16-like protein [Mya arenaria]